MIAACLPTSVVTYEDNGNYNKLQNWKVESHPQITKTRKVLTLFDYDFINGI